MNGVASVSSDFAGSGLGSLGQASMGKDEFLKLLVQQLKNQDPMSPMESQDFAAQLAQFSSLEQLTNMSGMMEESMTVDLMLTQAINNTMATSFIGKNISAVGNTVSMEPGTVSELSFKLEGQAKTVTVKIMNAAGNVVKEIEMDGLSAGKHFVEWDGTNANGEELPSGEYTFEVVAVDSEDNSVTATTMTTGNVTGIQYTNGGAVFIVNGNEIPFNQVLEITSSTEDTVSNESAGG